MASDQLTRWDVGKNGTAQQPRCPSTKIQSTAHVFMALGSSYTATDKSNKSYNQARHVISVCLCVAGISSITCSRSVCSFRQLLLFSAWPHFGQGKEESHDQSMWSHTQARGKKHHMLSEYVVLRVTRALCTVATLRAEFRTMDWFAISVYIGSILGQIQTTLCFVQY